VNGGPVLTRLFEDAGGLGEGRFWGMLRGGLTGVLEAFGRRMIVVNCGEALAVLMLVLVLAWSTERGGDALHALLTRRCILDGTDYHCFLGNWSNLASLMA